MLTRVQKNEKNMTTKTPQTPEILPFFDVLDFMKTDEGSLTLIVGNECLDQFFNDSEKAISKFPNHSTEIVLASLCRRLNSMQLTSEVEQLLNHTLDLIQIHDEVLSA